MQTVKPSFQRLKTQLTKFSRRQLLWMLVGNLILAFGLSLFNASAMGNHPFHTMFYGAESVLSPISSFFSYANLQIMLNIVLFLIELFFGFQYLGIGTIINMFLLGYCITFFTWIWNSIGLPDAAFAVRLVILLLGMLVLSLGLSLYQTANLGVAPYDSIPLILHNRTKIPFFWCRIMLDGVCFIATLLLHGSYGIGTVVTVFCGGPFIRFFDRTVSNKVMGKN